MFQASFASTNESFTQLSAQGTAINFLIIPVKDQQYLDSIPGWLSYPSLCEVAFNPNVVLPPNQAAKQTLAIEVDSDHQDLLQKCKETPAYNRRKFLNSELSVSLPNISDIGDDNLKFLPLNQIQFTQNEISRDCAEECVPVLSEAVRLRRCKSLSNIHLSLNDDHLNGLHRFRSILTNMKENLSKIREKLFKNNCNQQYLDSPTDKQLLNCAKQYDTVLHKSTPVNQQTFLLTNAEHLNSNKSPKQHGAPLNENQTLNWQKQKIMVPSVSTVQKGLLSEHSHSCQVIREDTAALDIATRNILPDFVDAAQGEISQSHTDPSKVDSSSENFQNIKNVKKTLPPIHITKQNTDMCETKNIYMPSTSHLALDKEISLYRHSMKSGYSQKVNSKNQHSKVSENNNSRQSNNSKQRIIVNGCIPNAVADNCRSLLKKTETQADLSTMLNEKATYSIPQKTIDNRLVMTEVIEKSGDLDNRQKIYETPMGKTLMQNNNTHREIKIRNLDGSSTVFNDCNEGINVLSITSPQREGVERYILNNGSQQVDDANEQRVGSITSPVSFSPISEVMAVPTKNFLKQVISPGKNQTYIVHSNRQSSDNHFQNVQLYPTQPHTLSKMYEVAPESFCYKMGEETQKACIGIASDEFTSSNLSNNSILQVPRNAFNKPPSSKKNSSLTQSSKTSPVVIHLTCSDESISQSGVSNYAEIGMLLDSEELFNSQENAPLEVKPKILNLDIPSAASVRKRLIFPTVKETVAAPEVLNAVACCSHDSFSQAAQRVKRKSSVINPSLVKKISVSKQTVSSQRQGLRPIKFTPDQIKGMADIICELYS